MRPSAAVGCLLLQVARLLAEDKTASTTQENGPKTGYVDCSSRSKKDLVPILLKICGRLPAGNLNCGQKVSVLERQGSWMEIAMPDGIPRYIDASLVSQADDKFVPFDAQSGISDKGAPNCPVHVHTNRAPYLVSQQDPDYTDEALKAKVQGTVVLALTVGTDGKPHDIKVERKLGHGLDSKAVEAVRQWRWEPALIDGKPAETKLTVYVRFRTWSF
jgi:TonB family protein